MYKKISTVDLNRFIKELNERIAEDPGHYFVDGWTKAIADMKAEIASRGASRDPVKLNKFQELTMSYWLKARIAEIKDRDVVDMYNDTLWLAELLKGLVDEATDFEAHNDYVERNQGRL